MARVTRLDWHESGHPQSSRPKGFSSSLHTSKRKESAKEDLQPECRIASDWVSTMIQSLI